MENGGDAVPRGLRVYNSLTRQKELFTTVDGSHKVSWYICGPTVYDSSHVGHARNYVTFDILRRILEDYFRYEVFYVMNVTDVDDKIIYRARRNYLLEQYRASVSDPCQVVDKLGQAFSAEISRQTDKVRDISELSIQAAEGSKQREELDEKLKQEQLKLSKLIQAQAETQTRTSNALSLGGKEGVDVLIADGAADALASYLDEEQGASVTDKTIFRSHALKYEQEFKQDMLDLGVRPPRVLTRVSDYIPEILDYIEKIYSRGFAYEVNGSVYFDTTRFEKSGHTYGKLNPWAVGNTGLASESEQNFDSTFKKSKCDFALWKASKSGEPSWPSRWGEGRPGWHIECSAMAGDVIGPRVDVHSGGLDLQFPHHTNEIAQAEAHYDCNEWVKYFLHSGHLSIDGLKMSKSLKNFITIKEALKKHTSRQLRFLFIMQSWDKPMNFNDAALNEAKAKERQLKRFFAYVNLVLKGERSDVEKWKAEEKTLNIQYLEAESQVRNRLEDNFDTSGAFLAILNLVKAVLFYIEKKVLVSGWPILLLTMEAASFVTDILRIFGLSDVQESEIGFGRTTDLENLVAPYLDDFSAFRQSIRAAARAGSSNEAILELLHIAPTFDVQHLPQGEQQLLSPYVNAFLAFKEEVNVAAVGGASKERILEITDSVRDGTLVDLGVLLDDTPLGPICFLDDVHSLRQERNDKLKAKLRKMEETRDKLRKEVEKWGGASSPPDVLTKYSRFDNNGFPTHDLDGKELSKQAKKKLEKELKNAADLREKLEVKLASDQNFLVNQKKNLLDLERKIVELGVTLL